jgi:hypothetical protein
MEINDWQDIQTDFSFSDVFFGNGLSIYFSEHFNYKNILELFLENGSLKMRKLFESYSTVNFEQVLKNLDIAIETMNLFSFDTKEVQEIKTEIKNGLLTIIEKVHPRPNYVKSDKLSKVASFLDEMNDVYTTNYDLMPYYAILNSVDYGDYFFEGDNLRYKKFNQNDLYDRKHIYYLHGSLFIFQQEYSTLKMKKSSTHRSLIEVIAEHLNDNKYPLFISEGSSEKKLEAIRLNPYLNFCFEKLQKNENENIVVYGSSLSEQDEHIINAINSNYKNIAISIYSYDKKKQLEKKMNYISSLFENSNVVFFKSDSLFK